MVGTGAGRPRPSIVNAFRHAKGIDVDWWTLLLSKINKNITNLKTCATNLKIEAVNGFKVVTQLLRKVDSHTARGIVVLAVVPIAKVARFVAVLEAE
jgi:hypothetical protein